MLVFILFAVIEYNYQASCSALKSIVFLFKKNIRNSVQTRQTVTITSIDLRIRGLSKL